jgi:thioredoxin reductase
MGVGVDWDPAIEAFAPRVAEGGATSVPGLFAAGEVARPVPAREALSWGRRAGEAALG